MLHGPALRAPRGPVPAAERVSYMASVRIKVLKFHNLPRNDVHHICRAPYVTRIFCQELSRPSTGPCDHIATHNTRTCATLDVRREAEPMDPSRALRQLGGAQSESNMWPCSPQ